MRNAGGSLDISAGDVMCWELEWYESYLMTNSMAGKEERRVEGMGMVNQSSNYSDMFGSNS